MSTNRQEVDSQTTIQHPPRSNGSAQESNTSTEIIDPNQPRSVPADPTTTLVTAPDAANPPGSISDNIQVLVSIDSNFTLVQTKFPGSGDSILDLPGYQVLGELGRGGMGVVYKAKQVGLNRLVALKMILSGSHAGSADLSRFRIEVESIARLQHANIVHIYDVDEHEGKPYFSLEYCALGPLDKQLAGKVLSPQEAAGLVETLARAMQVAHESGIVHRDLKPANVLLQSVSSTEIRQHGARLANHHCCLIHAELVIPKITDFGLAKDLDKKGGQTHTGVVMGTPSYMAPEQARGQTKDIGPTTDIYSLGAILYECLTGRPPFVGATPVETIMQVMNQEALPPRMLNRKIDPDLENIVLKCLEKDPKNRYATAHDLADDLHKYRNGEPISARSINLLERFQRELAHSQYDAQLRPWGTGLMYLALIIFTTHLLTSTLLVSNLSETSSFWIPRVLMITAILTWVKAYRPGWKLMPTNAIERLLWAVWIGYFLSFFMMFLVMHILGHNHLDIYGLGCVLSGMAWFVMGGYVWGGCYLIGWIFLGAAPVLATLSGSKWLPFYFGLIWSFVLLIMGLRYRSLGKAQEEKQDQGQRSAV